MVMAKIKVSQKTIDNIKSMGMTKTLESLKSIGQPGGRNIAANKEFIEGARRMYGTRVDKYLPAKSSSADAARGRATRAAASKSTAAKPQMKKSGPAKPAYKSSAKSNNNSNIIKGTLGAAAALGVLAASKGKGASVAAKLSPTIGKFASSPAGKAIFGTGEKLTTKGMVTSGKFAAKAGKPVSQSQYEAMVAAARAQGIKLPAAKAAAKTTAKTTAKKTVKKTAAKKNK
jgi:hypothetical protein